MWWRSIKELLSNLQELSKRGSEIRVIKAELENIQDAVAQVWKWGQGS